MAAGGCDGGDWFKWNMLLLQRRGSVGEGREVYKLEEAAMGYMDGVSAEVRFRRRRGWRKSRLIHTSRRQFEEASLRFRIVTADVKGG